eukprot:1386738-Alexandrium_andersonii.AAC.1
MLAVLSCLPWLSSLRLERLRQRCLLRQVPLSHWNPPPMAGGAEDDDPDAPWPDERGKAEVIDRVYVPPRKDTNTST